MCRFCTCSQICAIRYEFGYYSLFHRSYERCAEKQYMGTTSSIVCSILLIFHLSSEESNIYITPALSGVHLEFHDGSYFPINTL